MRQGIPYETLKPQQKLVAAGFVVLGIWYLVWRAGTLNPEAPVFSGLLYAVEIYGFAAALMHVFMTWRLARREPPAPLSGVSVDVFVPTYNESVDLVRKTLLAARAMDLPHTTWLLDDGNRAEMRALAERLGVRYLARTDNTHAKAGNLNHALAHSNGEFIAIFDADHAPQRNFLVRTLGYFRDDKLAFVQTPQDFFNLDSYQHRYRAPRRELWTEQSLFFKVIQRGKDMWNAAFFCGSCALVRRSALESVGGFATETVTEDLHTSIRMHKAGWRSVYHAESLAYGIAPAQVAPFLKQRVRWGQGAMHVLKIENPLWTRGLTLPQRLNYFASILTYFDGWQKGVFYLAPAVVILGGIMPIQTGALEFLLHFIPYYLLSFVLFEELGRGHGGTFYIEQYNFARFAAFAWATLALFSSTLKFGVTEKTRQGKARVNRMFLPQMAVLALNAVAIPIGLAAAMGWSWAALPPDALAFNVVWATVNGVLGVMTLRFTRRTDAFLRDEYRFPVPLPLVLEHGSQRLGTVDNVSSSGLRLYARLDGAAVGDLVEGRLILPSGPLSVLIELVAAHATERDGETYIKAWGGRYVWTDPAARDRLDLFLYGNDLQWKLLDIVEDTHTPLRWFARRWHAHPAPGHWAACRIETGDGRLHFGLVGLGASGRIKRLLSFDAVPTGRPVDVWVATRRGEARHNVRLAGTRDLPNAAGLVRVCDVTDTAPVDAMLAAGPLRETGGRPVPLPLAEAANDPALGHPLPSGHSGGASR